MQKRYWLLSGLLFLIAGLCVVVLFGVVNKKGGVKFLQKNQMSADEATAPQNIEMLWKTIQDEEVGEDGLRKAQMRGKFVRMSDEKMTLRMNDGEKDISLPSQVQYECMQKEMPEQHTGKPFPLSQAYLNLTRGYDGLGRMTMIDDVRQQLAPGDDVIVVGVVDKQGVFTGQLVVVIKC